MDFANSEKYLQLFEVESGSEYVLAKVVEDETIQRIKNIFFIVIKK
ncbi:hypothetical protein ACINWC743_A0626 [Acinetobacter sp. WC-743]|nr:hypothetical protein ACINWC743_A0626 [Acinetobacter sp. WC-743]